MRPCFYLRKTNDDELSVVQHTALNECLYLCIRSCMNVMHKKVHIICTIDHFILKENKTFQVTNGMSVRSGQNLQMCPLHLILYLRQNSIYLAPLLYLLRTKHDL